MTCNLNLSATLNAPCTENKKTKVEEFLKDYGKLLSQGQRDVIEFMSINLPNFILYSFEISPPETYRRGFTAIFIFGPGGDEGKYTLKF